MDKETKERQENFMIFLVLVCIFLIAFSLGSLILDKEVLTFQYNEVEGCYVLVDATYHNSLPPFKESEANVNGYCLHKDYYQELVDDRKNKIILIE